MIVLIFIVSLMSSWYPSDSISFKVPLDHFLANSQKISIWCDLRAPLDPDKDTILLLEDPLDQVFDNIELAEHIPVNFNLVTIKGRFQSPELNKFLNINTSIDFKRTYELLGQRQIAKDIEFIRKELLGE